MLEPYKVYWRIKRQISRKSFWIAVLLSSILPVKEKIILGSATFIVGSLFFLFLLFYFMEKGKGIKELEKAIESEKGVVWLKDRAITWHDYFFYSLFYMVWLGFLTAFLPVVLYPMSFWFERVELLKDAVLWIEVFLQVHFLIEGLLIFEKVMAFFLMVDRKKGEEGD